MCSGRVAGAVAGEPLVLELSEPGPRDARRALRGAVE